MAIAVVEQAPAQRVRVNLKIVASQPVLDDHLPEIGRTEMEQVLEGLEQCARLRRKSIGFPRSPQQHLGIEQPPHARAPNSARMASLPMW